MRAVLDTNVLIAALFWRGAPHALLEHVRSGTVRMVSSPALLAEFGEVIGRRKFASVLAKSNTSRERALGGLQALAELLDPPPLPVPVCRDPADDQVLALAFAAKPDFIVTGDEDLLSLMSFEGIAIITPAAAIKRVENL